MAVLQLPNLQTEGAITLVVGWRSSSKTQLRRVNLGSDVEVALRDVARAVLDDVLTREVESWTAEADSAPEVVHTLGVDEVGPSPSYRETSPCMERCLPPLHRRYRCLSSSRIRFRRQS